MKNKNQQRPKFKRRFIPLIALIVISIALFLVTQNQFWFTLFMLSISTLVFSALRRGRFYWGLPYPKYCDYLVYTYFLSNILMMLSVILSVIFVGYEQTSMNLFFKTPPFSYIWVVGLLLLAISTVFNEYVGSRLNKRLEKAVPEVTEEEVEEAKSVTLAYICNVRPVSEKTEEVAKNYLIKRESILLKRYATLINFNRSAGSGNREPFIVVETDPDGHVRVTEKTVVKILEEPRFMCPFCGSPYWDYIPVGATHVRCEHCWRKIPIPDNVIENLREMWARYNFLKK